MKVWECIKLAVGGAVFLGYIAGIAAMANWLYYAR